MLDGLLKRIVPLAAVTLSAGLAGCGVNVSMGSDGVPLDELDMTADAPTKLELAGPDSVILTQGDTLNVTAEGDQDAIDDLRFDLEGDTLEIGREDGNWKSDGKAIVRVTMPAPSELSMAGSGRIEAPTMADRAEIDIAGSGNIKVAQIESDSLEISIAGSGKAAATGTAARLEISIAGSGDVEMPDLTADEVEISIAGSGDVAIASDGDVEADIAGSGHVEVIGSATCTVNSMGSGTVTCSPRAER